MFQHLHFFCHHTKTRHVRQCYQWDWYNPILISHKMHMSLGLTWWDPFWCDASVCPLCHLNPHAPRQWGTNLPKQMLQIPGWNMFWWCRSNCYIVNFNQFTCLKSYSWGLQTNVCNSCDVTQAPNKISTLKMKIEKKSAKSMTLGFAVRFPAGLFAWPCRHGAQSLFCYKTEFRRATCIATLAVSRKTKPNKWWWSNTNWTRN